MMVDFRHFDRLTYKIFIKYDSSKIEPKNAKELQQFLIDLRNKYSIINDYEFIQVLEDYGLDFYPAKLSGIHRFKSALAGKHL